jgi:uncharacterized protein (TIGR03437 family)
MALLTVARAQTRPPAITSITVCSTSGAGGQGSCPAGTADTHQIVVAPDGVTSINTYASGAASDEHSSAFSPGMLGTNKDYLFVIAGGSRDTNTVSIGTMVLSGGAGPSAAGQWTMDFARTDGYGSYTQGYGQVFVPPMLQGNCPVMSDLTKMDATFDLDYAAPGSWVIDPTGPQGSLLMIYEGSNPCFGAIGGNRVGNGAYTTTGIATSLDYGKTWPTYRGTSTFSFVDVPRANPSQGPNLPAGAAGASVCAGNNCSTTPGPGYGRYAVLSPPTSITSVAATGQAMNGNMGDAEIAGLVDDVAGGATTYVYEVHGTSEAADIVIARAALNGGAAPLVFKKWDGTGWNAAGVGGAEISFLPPGGFENCGANTQLRSGASLYYVEPTHQYLLLFICVSLGDPALGANNGGNPGGSWFYSTNYNMADPTGWTIPQQIAGSYSDWDTSGGCPAFKGWYATAMSLAAKPGHLTSNGYIFYLWGCESASNSATPFIRKYSSRQFTISTAPLLTSNSVTNGATYIAGGLVPGSWAQVKGAGLSPVSRIWNNADFNGLGNKLPTNLAGVQVLVNNTPAAVYFIDPGQVSFQVPAGITGHAAVQVINNGQASNVLTAPAATSAPGIFPVIVNGANYPAGVFIDGKLVGDPAVNAAFRKAKAGDVISLFATGLAATPAGVLPSAQTVSGVTVTIGNVTVPASYAGLVAVGEFQINFTMPSQFATLAEGSYPITISVNGVSSPTNINSSPAGPLVVPTQH